MEADAEVHHWINLSNRENRFRMRQMVILTPTACVHVPVLTNAAACDTRNTQHITDRLGCTLESKHGVCR